MALMSGLWLCACQVLLDADQCLWVLPSITSAPASVVVQKGVYRRSSCVCPWHGVGCAGLGEAGGLSL